MDIGVLVNFRKGDDIVKKFKDVKALGLTCCQLCVWDMSLYTKRNASRVLTAMKKTGIKVTALWCGWSGPQSWTFTEGPTTLGLVPKKYRSRRVKDLKKGSDFAQLIGVSDIITHVGFIPEVGSSKEFKEVIDCLKDLATFLKERGQYFLFETGQETPVTMLRTIEAIGTDNLGINFDTANLILYGSANSVDALEVFGKYVRNTHFKDGFYPVSGNVLGREAALGEGRANVPGIYAKLQELGYTGPYVIERECEGEEQVRDIKLARDLLLKVAAEYNK